MTHITTRLNQFASASFLMAALSLSVSPTALAHVVVKPTEVETASFQTFTIGVPNEKELPTTAVKLVIPDGLTYASPTVKPGWQINIEKTGSGESAITTAITWTGGAIDTGLRDDFSFSGKVPDQATNLQWKAYQTYADGSVVAWDQANEAGHHQEGNTSGPFSVTKVVAETEAASAVQRASQAAASARATSSTSLYVGIAGLIVGLVAIFLSTRKA